AQQQILAASVNPELFGAGFIADNMEKVLIARTLCRIGDADYLTLCVKYARSFPDAALEMAACLQVENPALAREILSAHLNDPTLRIRRATRKALARIGGATSLSTRRCCCGCHNLTLSPKSFPRLPSCMRRCPEGRVIGIVVMAQAIREPPSRTS